MSLSSSLHRLSLTLGLRRSSFSSSPLDLPGPPIKPTSLHPLNDPDLVSLILSYLPSRARRSCADVSPVWREAARRLQPGVVEICGKDEYRQKYGREIELTRRQLKRARMVVFSPHEEGECPLIELEKDPEFEGVDFTDPKTWAQVNTLRLDGVLNALDIWSDVYKHHICPISSALRPTHLVITVPQDTGRLPLPLYTVNRSAVDPRVFEHDSITQTTILFPNISQSNPRVFVDSLFDILPSHCDFRLVFLPLSSHTLTAMLRTASRNHPSAYMPHEDDEHYITTTLANIYSRGDRSKYAKTNTYLIYPAGKWKLEGLLHKTSSFLRMMLRTADSEREISISMDRAKFREEDWEGVFEDQEVERYARLMGAS